MHDFEELFDTIAGLKIAIVGDIMLDTYWWGRVDRISPEAPVPVVSLNNKEYRPGGASNVAFNTVALKAATTVFSIVGEDDNAVILLDILRQQIINTDFVIKSAQRVTTNKTRIISRNQQMMRLDEETIKDILPAEEQQLIANFTAYVDGQKPDVVIFEDYNKGVLTENIINTLIGICQKHNILTAVDPKRKNFFAYKGVDIFKPNLSEVKDGLNILLDEVNKTTLQDVHEKLHEKLGHHISLITLSEKGVFVQEGQESHIIPTHQRNITDVSGAGDTVIAVASLVYAATRSILLAAKMANLAGGLVCEEVGTAAINAQRLLVECNSSLGSNI